MMQRNWPKHKQLYMLNKKLYAFTLSELMITMALTSLMITFAYLGFNYIQKLLVQYNQQSSFINELNTLNDRLETLSGFKNLSFKEGDNTYVFKTDSATNYMEFKNETVLIKGDNSTDTFHLKALDIKNTYEILNNPLWQNRLLNKIEFDVSFEKQKFHVSFNKQYDSCTLLKLEKENTNGLN